MKIRTGFVSNSSSSSFVVLGWMIPYTREVYQDLREKLDAVKSSFCHMAETGSRNDILVGFCLADIASDDGGLGESELSIQELDDAAREIQSIVGVQENPKFYSGTRSL